MTEGLVLVYEAAACSRAPEVHRMTDRQERAVTAMARQSHRMAPRSDEHTREALRDHRDAARRSEPQRRDSTTTVWRAQLEGSQVVHDFDTEDEAMAWADAAANPDHWVVVWAVEVRG